MRIRPLRLHLDRHVGLFGSFISCIGNLGCLSYLSSIVLWFEFDLISQLILGFTADFVLQTSISIYSDFIWLCVKFELGWSQRKLWAPRWVLHGQCACYLVSTFGTLGQLHSFLFLFVLLLWTFVSPHSDLHFPWCHLHCVCLIAGTAPTVAVVVPSIDPDQPPPLLHCWCLS